MERYKVIKEVGDGAFGNVWRAVNKHTGEIVAIKRMKRKYYSWEECMNLREVKSLQRMNHPNIVELKEVIRENDVLYFVFEYMECNLLQLMRGRGKLFSVAEICSLCFQIFQALAYMHQRGYFHRDLKPENLLVTKDVVKIADFGLAREVFSQPPYTQYVSTRWYRAPEVLLQASVYDSAVDMWAMGAIMAEMFTLCPLFPGSSEADEIYKICSIIGTPSQYSWAEGLQLANVIKYQFPQLARVHLSMLIPSASDDAINLISSLCSWDPSKRPSAAQVLQHSFFQPCFYIPPSLRMRSTGMPKCPQSVEVRGALEQNNARRYSTVVLSNTMLANNFSSTMMGSSLTSGVDRKLESDQEAKKNERSTNSYPKQARYQPPARNPNPGTVDSGQNSAQVFDAADKLAQLTLSTLPRPVRQRPPSMKAGGWRDQADPLGRFHEMHSAASYTRKAVR